MLQNLQAEALRMLKASEKLPSSSHKLSQESSRMSYNVLNLANEYLEAVNDREGLLRRAIKFFNSAKSVSKMFNFVFDVSLIRLAVKIPLAISKRARKWVN